MLKLVYLGIIIASIGFLTFGPVNTQFKKAASQYTALTTINIPISGTGSMYPTFPKGIGKTSQELSEELVAVVGMYAYPNARYKIGRGDIVEFRNAKTDEIESRDYGSDEISGFVKRVIGLSGDTFEIRGGQIYINGEVQTEPYTALARSTFGGTFLADCTKLKIPDGKYFVMGDNRKASNDSRYDVELIDEKDIGFILPYEKQKGVWDKNFRNTSKDNELSSKITLNKQEFVDYLNSLRKEAGLESLKYVSGLEKSAMLRGQNILAANDFSFEATKSGYTIDKSFNDAGYWNPVKGESLLSGYYTAEELIEGLSQFKKPSSMIVDKDIEEIGIAEVEGEINGCPTQVIITHFAGYIPPNYPKDQIESFKKGLESLENISPKWKSLREEKYASFYLENKDDINRIIEIIDFRIEKLKPIVQKISTNQWLTGDESNYLKQDEALAEELNSLSEKMSPPRI